MNDLCHLKLANNIVPANFIGGSMLQHFMCGCGTVQVVGDVCMSRVHSYLVDKWPTQCNSYDRLVTAAQWLWAIIKFPTIINVFTAWRVAQI